jgi:hypothetical protein
MSAGVRWLMLAYAGAQTRSEIVTAASPSSLGQ